MKQEVLSYHIDMEHVSYEFGQDGLIRKVTVKGFDGAEYPVASDDFGRIRIAVDSGELVPYSPVEPLRIQTDDAVFVEFPEILWRDADGEEVPDFRLSLRYELLSSGRAFVHAFFCSSNMHPPALRRFSLNYDWGCGAFKNVRWAVLKRPEAVDGALIQALPGGRCLSPGVSQRREGEIVPSVSMNLRAITGESAYFESIVEGANSLSGDHNDNFTDLVWKDNGDFHVEYSFIRDIPCSNKTMQLFQWRNQWGWVVKTPDRVRHLPPYHMYHYFDNFVRYPSDECLENLARSNTDVLVIHENWRFDIQNDGIPFKSAELCRVIEKAHALGMRIALYMRGNERSSEEGACRWFDTWLRKDWDGLYMDYGGPIHLTSTDESYPDGKIEFRKYLTTMENLRKRVGRDGIFFGHTGPSFSAIWYASGGSDGYVSGEGEMGVMVSSRADHEYFSMAAVATGTMWTGAFPVYSTARMRPFLAAAGQYPHCPLGEQFRSSSLAHPREPGVSDHAFRPLWKLWRFFRKEKDIRILNDYNSFGVFQSSSPETGHYLMVSADRKRAILIVSNFSDRENTFTLALNRRLCGFDAAGMQAFKLCPTEITPGKAVPLSGEVFAFELNGNDVGAVYFESDRAFAKEQINDFEREYPPLSDDNRKYLAVLQEQEDIRHDRKPHKKCYLRLTVPNTNLSYEYSMVYDLYCNVMALVEFMPDGTKKQWGWISRKGFVTETPEPEDYIWPDVYSPRIALHEILPPGEHHLGIESLHYGQPFYSFCAAELTDDEAGTNPRTLCFRNELEPERQFLRWNIILQS